MNKILEELKKKIDGNSDDILEYIINNSSEKFTEAEIEEFLDSVSDEEKFTSYYTISGAGGSGIIKPNITSIAFLYLASMNIPMIKIGSRKRKSLNGSTDFFSKLGLLNFNINDKKYRFCCLDGYSVSRWKKYKELLSINESFNHYFMNNEYQDYTLKSKISIQLNKKTSEIYLSKKIGRKPEKLYVIYNESNIIIDEIIGGKIYVNGSVYINKEQNENYFELHKIEDINKINNSLLLGKEDTNSFWYNVLKNEVAIFLYLNKFYDSYQRCESIFDKIYSEKYVEKMLKYCNRDLGSI